MGPLVAVLLLLACGLSPAGAQKSDVVPARPKLPVAADTNDADAYYQLGLALVDSAPGRAADAFYWAARLNPHQAYAFYGRHAALLMAEPARIERYLKPDAKAERSPDVARLDSLLSRALMLDPLLYRKFDLLVLRQYYHRVRRTHWSGRPIPPRIEIDYAFGGWIARADAGTKGLVAYCEARFADALREYAAALRKAPKDMFLRVERGHTLYLAGEHDSALAELEAVRDELRRRDDVELVRLYTSKARLDHAIAKIHERLGDVQKAREAYGRALEEDLAFAPAHVGLGLLALKDGDTTTALNELDLAVQIKDAEPMVRLFYGYLLTQAGRFDNAEAQLTKAIELEPFYARSYQLLAEMYEKQRKPARAIAYYEAYLARAARNDAPRESIARHLEALKLVGGPSR
jgi:tetratricopeptide (TPR) repeat protein